MKKALHVAFVSLSLLVISACALPVSRQSEQLRPGEETPTSYYISLAGQWKMKFGDLAPAGLYLPFVNDTTWSDIHIPSNWYLQGIDHSGVIWFRKHFTADPGWRNKVIKLVFEGVDYTADVWLNGHYLGFHEGYFSPFSFIITDFIHLGGDNVLAVRVSSPYEEPGRVWSLRKRLIKGVFNHHDTRPGGAWSLRGQEKNTGGIWAPVYLKVSEQVSVDGIKITPQIDLKNRTAKVRLIMTITSLGSSRGNKFAFLIKVSPYNFIPEKTQEIRITSVRTLIQGKNEIEFDLPSMPVRLWWPWDHGRPNLYQLDVSIFQDGKELDHAQQVFGFRTVECDKESMLWKLNGQRIFLRGTNYISTQWLSEMSTEKYAYDIALMKKANINVVRVHAHIEAESFYRLCDEAGLMVWQDFPLQWGYTDDPAFIEEAKRQAGEMIDLLYNHPSIIAWCGHNEPPWDASWMKYKYKDYDPDQNRVLDDQLYAYLKSADPTRYVHKNSSTAEHPWFGWYSGTWKDYARPSKQPFITEFGAQALPGLDTLQKIFHKADPWPSTEEDWEKWSYHNFQRHETFNIARVPMGRNIHEFIANTQEYQARLIKYAAESYRRQRFKPISGIFQFMFVEDWPSINWGIVDYWRNPKPGYEALKTAFQPVLPSIEWEKRTWRKGENFKVNIWVINDLFKGFNRATLMYTLLKEDRVVIENSIVIDIKPDSIQKVISLNRNDLSEGEYELVTTIFDNNGKSLGQNRYRFSIKGQDGS